MDGELGYCQCSGQYEIGSICIHSGEEPVICGQKGICNIFFMHCNLQCIFCQNYQISNNESNALSKNYSTIQIVDKIIGFLNEGCEAVGFVSPSHFAPHVHAIIDSLRENEFNPVTVYNTNGYDKVETLKTFEEKINIYLPDFKYFDSSLAKSYSDAKDYPQVVMKAIKEMQRQKGNSLIINEKGQAINGLIIRHLVLPGQIENSKRILRWIAEEIGNSVHISLMAQYQPIPAVSDHKYLSRKITSEEYNEVIEEMEILGFYNGWIQELDSSDYYNPDFIKEHPFD
jgi:putative pyruvate formate lyase activating enzyme